LYIFTVVDRYLVVGWLSSDRELDSLLSATPFNIIYFHSIIVAILFVF